LSRPGNKLCEICEVKEAVGSCKICGRLVCEKHLEGDICSVCKELMCNICGINLSVTTCPVCGRLICRDCAAELQPGIRICHECFRNLDYILLKKPELSYLRKYIRHRNPRKSH